MLRTAPLRESDLLVTLFTEEHGRVSAVARGARKSQRRFAGALSLLVLARFQLGRKPRGDLWSLDAAEIEREWTQLSHDVVAVAHASYVAELAGALLPAETPEPHALALIVEAWDSLAANGPSPAVLRAIELELLDLAGHRPALEACAADGETNLDRAVFDPSRGGAICRACAAQSKGPGVRPLDAATRAYLVAISEVGSPIDARALDTDERFTGADRSAARDAMVSMVTAFADRPLRSLEYIAKLGAAARR